MRQQYFYNQYWFARNILFLQNPVIHLVFLCDDGAKGGANLSQYFHESCSNRHVLIQTKSDNDTNR